MSNHFWIGLAAIAGGGYLLLRKPKPAAGADASRTAAPGAFQGSQGGAEALTDYPTGAAALAGTAGGVSAYGQYPGNMQAGAAGVDSSASGASGTLDNSRVFDPYAQSQADPQWDGSSAS
jgi:hypothetical protein